MKQTGIIVLIALTIASCRAGRETANSDIQQNNRKVACADIHVDMGQAHIDWFEEKSNVLNKSKELIVLPKEYKVYSVDSTQIAEFFNKIHDQGATLSSVVPLPEPAGCRLFEFRNNIKEGATPPAGHIFTYGVCLEQKMMLNCDRYGTMHGFVEWYELLYEIMPVKANGTTYYVVYQKQKQQKETPQKQAPKGSDQLIEYKPVK